MSVSQRLKELFIITLVVITLFLIIRSMSGATIDTGNFSNSFKIQEFIKNKELQCGNRYGGYLVSKKRGWKLQKDIFVKGDGYVSITDCRLRSE